MLSQDFKPINESNVKHIPISIKLFIFTGILYILQLIPLVGVFLMMFAAAWWSIITVNLGFALMIYEVRSKRIPRWCIIFPILYFGGYFTWMSLSHIEYYLLRSDIAKSNQSVQLPFDYQKHALIFIEDYNSTYGVSEALVQLYDLPIVYRKYTENREHAYTADRIAGRLECESKQSSGSKYWFEDQRKICSIRDSRKPVLPEVRIIPQPKQQGRRVLLPAVYNTIVIQDTLLQKYNITIGVVSLPTLLPMPIIGCGLNSAKSSWECTAEFYRKNEVPIGYGKTHAEGEAALIAGALGLKKASTDFRMLY